MDGNIGDSYVLSIGQTNVDVGQAVYVDKKTNRTFWSRVQEALADAKRPVTQVEAARIARVTQPTVSDWNKPGGYPTIENAVSLGRGLNVCVEWLLTERGPKNPGPPAEADAQELWSLWPHLDDRTKVRIVTIASENARPAGDEGQRELHRS